MSTGTALDSSRRIHKLTSCRCGVITPESANDLARVFLADAYRMRLRRAGKTVEHPIAVGELLTDDR